MHLYYAPTKVRECVMSVIVQIPHRMGNTDGISASKECRLSRKMAVDKTP